MEMVLQKYLQFALFEQGSGTQEVQNYRIQGPIGPAFRHNACPDQLTQFLFFKTRKECLKTGPNIGNQIF